jgi:hypothetical protein
MLVGGASRFSHKTRAPQFGKNEVKRGFRKPKRKEEKEKTNGI